MTRRIAMISVWHVAGSNGLAEALVRAPHTFRVLVLDRPVSVLWRPPGARDFRSRQAWGRQVAYGSQFIDRINRAHLGKSRIKRRLIADLDPDEWDLPPKPKWMRWSTYNRYVDRYDKYEVFLKYGCAAALDRLLAKISK